MSSPWIQAIRLRTLPLAWASLTMGAALAISHGVFDWSIYLLSLLTAFSLQILSNLANDYGDAVSGLDGAARVGPKRTIQDGLITKAQMKKAIVITGVLSFSLGLWLIYISFQDWYLMLIFLVLGLGAIGAAINYTVGSNPYGYSGWGDLFVLIFFGWIGVSGSYLLYNGYFDPITLLPGTSLGLLAVAVLNVNNIRDIESDKVSGKFSIPVKIGRVNAVRYHAVVLILAMVCMIIFGLQTHIAIWEWSFMLIIPLLLTNWLAVRNKTEANELDPYLKQMAMSTLVFVLLFLVGVLVSL